MVLKTNKNIFVHKNKHNKLKSGRIYVLINHKSITYYLLFRVSIKNSYLLYIII